MSDKDSEKRPAGTTVTGVQLLVGIIFVPVVMVWLALGARIIWSATGNPETLDQIEGLLTSSRCAFATCVYGLGQVI